MPKHTSAGEDMIQSADRCNNRFTSANSFGAKLFSGLYIMFALHNQCTLHVYLDAASQHTYNKCSYMSAHP